MMPVFDTSIKTKFVDGSTDLGGKGWVLKDYIIDVYPNLAPGVKTPALWLWGYNSSGRLGDNTVTNRPSPVQTVTGGTAWKQISCAIVAGPTVGFTACVKVDGTLWLWGNNNAGELGDDTTASRSSPVQTITGGANWKQVACGYRHIAAVKTDGTLWLWGFNTYYGMLGDNTTTSKSSPVQTITGGTNWKQVSCGYSHTGAIKTDGTLWTWGRNDTGQLGDNTTDSKFSPVQTITGGTNWKQVSCGEAHTAAVKTDGTLWLWGANQYRQIGDNTGVRKSSPVQTIAGGTNWSQVACGHRHTAAVKTDGTLWLWGQGADGALGDNTLTSRSSPVQTITGGTNWKQVSCGRFYTAAVKADGTLWLWGNNGYGRLGDNTTTRRTSPVQTIMRGTTWKQVSCGYNHTGAIADGNY